MFHIAIIGVGRVGSTLAHLLMSSGRVDRLDLVDVIPSLSWAVKEDLLHAVAQLGINIEIYAYEDAKLVEGADVIILTAGKARTKEASRRELVGVNFRIIGWVMDRLVGSNEDSIYFVVTNPVDAIATFVSDFVGEKVFGVGTTLETARMRSFIARKLRVSVNDVVGWVGGEHGESAVILWSTVRVRGKSFHHYESKLSRDDVESYVKNVSKEIIRGQGATIWGPATVFYDLILGILLNKGYIASYSVLTELPSLNRKVHVSIPREVSISPKYSLWKYLDLSERQSIINSAKEILNTYYEGLRLSGFRK